MKDRKNIILSGVAIFALIALLVGTTFAYYFAQYGDTSKSADIDVYSNTTDNFSIQVSDDIALTIEESDLVQNGTSKYGEATAVVTLRPNNSTGFAMHQYSISIDLAENNTTYSKGNTTHEPELLLQVFDSNNNSIEIEGLGERINNGYDITGKTGVYLLNEEILNAINGQTASKTFRVRISFVNLNLSQNDNIFMNVIGRIIVNDSIGSCTNNKEKCVALFSNSSSTNKVTSLNCNNGAFYNYGLNQIEISSVGTNTCILSFNDPETKEYLNNYIISLENTNQGDGMVIHETVPEFTTIDNQTTTEAGYRYEGKNPNNYIWFNNELWRIIGVFGSESHGQTGKQLVKIIRNDSLGGSAWNVNPDINNWNTSSLKALLNGAYYNHTTDTNNCYGYSTSSGLGAIIISPSCDYTKKGIQSSYQGMIKNVTWYLGGNQTYTYNNYVSLYSYQFERTGNVYSGYPTTGEGKIGLMYVSDFLYGVKASACERPSYGIPDNYYSALGCAEYNWIFKGSAEWTMTQRDSSVSQAYGLSMSGSIQEVFVGWSGLEFRPVLYLSESVYKISGTGTQRDPYIIGM